MKGKSILVWSVFLLIVLLLVTPAMAFPVSDDDWRVRGTPGVKSIRGGSIQRVQAKDVRRPRGEPRGADIKFAIDR